MSSYFTTIFFFRTTFTVLPVLATIGFSVEKLICCTYMLRSFRLSKSFNGTIPTTYTILMRRNRTFASCNTEFQNCRDFNYHHSVYYTIKCRKQKDGRSVIPTVIVFQIMIKIKFNF